MPVEKLLLNQRITDPRRWIEKSDKSATSPSLLTVTTLLGLLIAFIDLRITIRGRRILDYLSILPLGVPGIVLAVGLLQAWIRSPIPIYSTIWIIFIAYMTRYVPLSALQTRRILFS